ncbi:hypothetical protein RND71_032144 [Anisodus tanguticus]|uniref:Uncharacterized protein n=1 Tax=Anisodus tanguticus TaxID=243964 RepID=A0AAE1V5J7_9SOLA|nr:hypothetical protein RND71_032144 [Anisodus tanguticus]
MKMVLHRVIDHRKRLEATALEAAKTAAKSLADSYARSRRNGYGTVVVSCREQPHSPHDDTHDVFLGKIR